MGSTFTIGKLAALANVNVETVRYYHRRGLLDEPEKPLRGHRRYIETDLKRLQFIKRSQMLGFTLDEIGVLLGINNSAGCQDMRTLLEKKKMAVDLRLSELLNIQSELKNFLCNCSGAGCSGPCAVMGALNRPLFQDTIKECPL